MLHGLLVRLEVDTGHAKVVAAPHKAGTGGQSCVVGRDSLLGSAEGDFLKSFFYFQPLIYLFEFARVAPSLFQRRESSGLAAIAALKQSTALSKSPDRLNKTPRPACVWYNIDSS